MHACILHVCVCVGVGVCECVGVCRHVCVGGGGVRWVGIGCIGVCVSCVSVCCSICVSIDTCLLHVYAACVRMFVIECVHHNIVCKLAHWWSNLCTSMHFLMLNFKGNGNFITFACMLPQ